MVNATVRRSSESPMRDEYEDDEEDTFVKVDTDSADEYAPTAAANHHHHHQQQPLLMVQPPGALHVYAQPLLSAAAAGAVMNRMAAGLHSDSRESVGGDGGGGGSQRSSGSEAGGTRDPEKRIRREIANSNERRRMQSINTGFQELRALLPHRDGDKISKASVLQQTAEFIRELLEAKARLAVENDHLKCALRPANGGMGGSDGNKESSSSTTSTLSSTSCSLRTSPATDSPTRHAPAVVAGMPPKKRKRFVGGYANSGRCTNSRAHLRMCADMYTDEGMATDESKSQPSPREVKCEQATVLSAVAAQQHTVSDMHMHSQLMEMRMALNQERQLRAIIEDELQRRNDIQQRVQQQRFTLTPAQLAELQQQQALALALQQQLNTPNMASLKQAMDSLVRPPVPQCNKQSLELIVDAIRHLEGDQLFVDTGVHRTGGLIVPTAQLSTDVLLHNIQQQHRR